MIMLNFVDLLFMVLSHVLCVIVLAILLRTVTLMKDNWLVHLIIGKDRELASRNLSQFGVMRKE